MKNTRQWLLAAMMASMTPAMSGFGAAQEAKVPQASVGSKATPPRPSKVEVTEISVENKSTQVQLTPNEQVLWSFVGVPSEASTSLKFRVSVPGKIILGEDTAPWKIDSFADDKGTDLFAAPGQAPKDKDLKMGSVTQRDVMEDGEDAQDGESYDFEVTAVGGLPAADASRLSLKGTIALLCGTGRSTKSQKNVALKVGTKITASPIPLVISSIKTIKGSDGFPTTFDVTLKSDGPIDRLLTIEGDGADAGVAVNSNGGAGRPYPLGGNTWVLTLSQMVPSLTLKITSLDKVETVSIPLQVSVGLDMGG